MRELELATILWERELQQILWEESCERPEEEFKTLAVGAGCAVAGEVSRVVPVDGTGKVTSE